MRKDAREAVCKLVYQNLLGGEADSLFRHEIYREHGLTSADVEFADLLYKKVCDNTERLSTVIGSISGSYSTERIGAVERAVLMIAMTEIESFDDIPDVVSVNEAVGLVKKYSEERSAGFINGILAEYLRRKNQNNTNS